MNLLDRKAFHKKFSVGLLLDTSLQEFNTFLDDYAEYIENFYFSLPMGDRFHSRRRVVEQFHNLVNIDQFWKQLKMINDHGIKLEVLFNTENLSAEDVANGKKMLEEHNVFPQKVGLHDDVFEAVHELFPQNELVYSFNNFPSKMSDFDAKGHQYSEYVLGRQWIRNFEAMDYIHKELHGHVVLLVNNGCSHICGGCSTQRHCFGAYQSARRNNSAEYLYALQSIMPFELHEGLLPMDKFDLIKINSRNTDIRYLRHCIESYLACNEIEWINETKEHFSLWAHLTWHMSYYKDFDLKRIVALKHSIYEGTDHHSKLVSNEDLPVMVDLCDRYIFQGSQPFEMSVLSLETVKQVLRDVMGYVQGVCIGISSCEYLLPLIDVNAVLELIKQVKQQRMQVWFVLPPMHDSMRHQAIELLDRLSDIDTVYVNDAESADMIRQHLPYTVGAGPETKLKKSPCIYDATEHGIYCSENDVCAVRYPLAQMCRGICPLKSVCDETGYCEQHPCLWEGEHVLHTELSNLHRVICSGDQMMHYATINDDDYITVLSRRYTILLKPFA